MEKEVLRGEIYLVDMRTGIHSEQSGIRPVLVIQNDVGNAQSPTVIVASITSKLDKPSQPTHVAVGTSCGLHMDSIVLMEQIRTMTSAALVSASVCSIRIRLKQSTRPSAQASAMM